MKKETLQLEVPEFISIEKYTDINSYVGESNFGRLVHSVAKITGREMSEVRKWSVDSLTKVVNIFADIADHKEEFHSIIEWNGELLGYAHMKQTTLGEYIDLENLCKDLENNMHKVAAIFYRPITKHKFNDLSFTVKQKIKMLNNDVANVFDQYTIEEYDSEKRKEVEDSFKDFPVHIFLGALSFFLSTASLYLNNIAYSEGRITKMEKTAKEEVLMETLLANTGAGGGLFTTSLNPIYYKYLATSP
jgi:hypothetical protein